MTHDGRIELFSLHLPTLKEEGVQRLTVTPMEAIIRLADGSTDTRDTFGIAYKCGAVRDAYVRKIELAYYTDVYWLEEHVEAPLVWVIEWTPEPGGEDAFIDYILAGEF